jgi:hypothetical protein
MELFISRDAVWEVAEKLHHITLVSSGKVMMFVEANLTHLRGNPRTQGWIPEESRLLVFRTRSMARARSTPWPPVDPTDKHCLILLRPVA